MKKLISLILTLALCLTAVSVFAEATPSKTAADTALADSAAEVTVEAAGVTVDATANAISASKDLLSGLSNPAAPENLDTIYDNAVIEDTRDVKTPIDLANVTSVTTAPLPAIIVADPAAAAESVEEVIIAEPIDDSTIAFLQSFDPAPTAVYTYLKDGALVSAIIDYEIVPAANPFAKPTIQFSIPLKVLADASGCPAFVNFVVEVK